MDFLESDHCILDLAKEKLLELVVKAYLKTIGDKLTVSHTDIPAEGTNTISPVREMEIMGNTNIEDSGTWLVKD